MNRKVILILLLLLTAAAVCSCGKGGSITKITIRPDGAEAKGVNAASVDCKESGSVTITKSGTYEISGSGSLQLIVDVKGGKAVVLRLCGVDLTCDSGAPVVVKSATLVAIELAEGTQNTLTDRHLYTPPAEGEEKDDSIPSAAIYSRAPLLIEGNGKLTVNAESYNGISTSDTLTVKGGNISITANHHGLKGKDYVVISGGNLNIKSEGDGIKATNTENPALGYINITGGAIVLNADDEGMYAPSSISVSGGNLSLKTKQAAVKTVGQLNLSGGIIDIRTGDDAFAAARQNITPDVIITVNGRPYSK